MIITIESLCANGFEAEEYAGKIFYRKGNDRVTYDNLFNRWLLCAIGTHNIWGYVDTMEQLLQLIAEAKHR